MQKKISWENRASQNLQNGRAVTLKDYDYAMQV